RAGDGVGEQRADPGTQRHGKLPGKMERCCPVRGTYQECHTGLAARTVAVTSPRHSVGTRKELSSNFSPSLINSGKRWPTPRHKSNPFHPPRVQETAAGGKPYTGRSKKCKIARAPARGW